MQDVLTFFGGTVIGGFIGYGIQHFLDLRSARKLEEMNKKRELYENMIDSLNTVFISGRKRGQGDVDKLLTSYQRQWLWASDDVVKKASAHLAFQVEFTSEIPLAEED